MGLHFTMKILNIHKPYVLSKDYDKYVNLDILITIYILEMLGNPDLIL